MSVGLYNFFLFFLLTDTLYVLVPPKLPIQLWVPLPTPPPPSFFILVLTECLHTHVVRAWAYVVATTLGIIPSSFFFFSFPIHLLFSQKGFAKEVEISLALGGGVRALWQTQYFVTKHSISLLSTCYSLIVKYIIEIFKSKKWLFEFFFVPRVFTHRVRSALACNLQFGPFSILPYMCTRLMVQK